MPPSPARSYPVDLWLCGHHYRASVAELIAADAQVEFVDDVENQFFREPAATVAT
jgi:hypothetical protein